MLLAILSTISKALNKLYKPKKFKEVMEYSMWKILKKTIQEMIQSFIDNAIWSVLSPNRHRKIC